MAGEGFVTKKEFELAMLRVNRRLTVLRPTEVYERDTYTKSEIDALLALQDELSEMEDVSLAGLAANDILIYNGAKWANYVLTVPNFNFDEGVLGESVTNIIQALQKLMYIEDAFDGVLNIDEGVLP